MASQYLQFTFQEEKAETMEMWLNDDHGKLLLMPHLIHHHAHCGTEVILLTYRGSSEMSILVLVEMVLKQAWLFAMRLYGCLACNCHLTPPSLPTPLVSYQTTSTIVPHQKTESLHQGEHLVDWHHHHEQLLPHLRWTVH